MVATVDELRNSYDWQRVFTYAAKCDGTIAPNGAKTPAEDGFTFDDLAEVVATVDGENDGVSWIGVFRLRDGRFAYVEAGCDYTGWD